MPSSLLPSLVTARVATGRASEVERQVFISIATVGAFALGGPYAAAGVNLGLQLLLPHRKVPGFEEAAIQRLQSVRSPVTPWRRVYGQVRVGGVYTFMETTTEPTYLHAVLTIAAHECEELGEVWFGDEPLTIDGAGEVTAPAKYAGFVRIQKSLGGEAGGVQPFPDLVTASDGLWTAAHCQTGHAKMYLRFNIQNNVFAPGLPTVTCVVKGRKVLDPRYSPAASAWSDNDALCLADYLCSDLGPGCVYAEEISEPALIAAANVCDELVALAGASPTEYERRYTANGVISADMTPRDVLAQMMSAMAGNIRFVGGLWVISAGVYPTPEATALTADDLRGAIRIVPRLSRRELCNGVKGVYVSAANSWQPTDFPPVTNATYLTEDQDERIWHEFSLAFTTSSATAQRLAKIDLEKTRQQITIEWPGKLTCYRLQPGDVVPVTMSKFGYAAKAFEVISSTLVHEEDGQGGIALGCDLVLRETASTVYDWSSGEETVVDDAPDTNLPDFLQPSNITGAVVRQNGAVVIFECDKLSDPHLDAIEIRKAPLGTTDWDMATLPAVTRILRGNTSTSAAVEPGDFTFMFKAQDRSGNYSLAAATYDLTITGAGFEEIQDVLEAPAWVGGDSATFLRHWTGVLVVESTKKASEHTIVELFEQFVPYPVPVATWTAPEIDKSIDADVRVRSIVTVRAGRDHTDGDVKPAFEFDYKLAAGAYDGYEVWTVGTAKFRYGSGQIVLDTSQGVPVIEQFEIIMDAQTRSENFPNMAVASGGTAFTFTTPFHNAPSITITPVGTTALRTSVESPSGTGGIAHLYNTADAGVAGTVNVTALGA